MIGSVEQLLIDAKPSPPHGAGAEEQKSATNTAEQGPSFLALLAQFFGSLIHPSTTVKSQQIQPVDSVSLARSAERGELIAHESDEAPAPSMKGHPVSSFPSVPTIVNTSEALTGTSLPRGLFVQNDVKAKDHSEVAYSLTTPPSTQSEPDATVLEDAMNLVLPKSETPARPAVIDQQGQSVPETLSPSDDQEPSVTVVKEGRVSGNSEFDGQNTTSSSMKEVTSASVPERSAHVRATMAAQPETSPEYIALRIEPSQESNRPERQAVPEASAGLLPRATEREAGEHGRASKSLSNSTNTSVPIAARQASVQSRESGIGHGESNTLPTTSESEPAADYPVDWSKMSPVSQDSPAETANGLKAVADSFTRNSRSRTTASRSNDRTEVPVVHIESVDEQVELHPRNVAMTPAVQTDKPEDTDNQEVRASTPQKRAASASDEPVIETIPDWTRIQVASKDRPTSERLVSVQGAAYEMGAVEEPTGISQHEVFVQPKTHDAGLAEGGVKTPMASVKWPEDFARKFVGSIADELRLHVAGRASEVRVQLKPEHLGELSLRVTMQDGEMTAHMEVSVPAVKAALDAQLPQLREALASHGIEVRRFDIVADNGMQHRSPQEQQRSQYRYASKRQTDVEVAETYAAMRSLGYNTVEYII